MVKRSDFFFSLLVNLVPPPPKNIGFINKFRQNDLNKKWNLSKGDNFKQYKFERNS